MHKLLTLMTAMLLALVSTPALAAHVRPQDAAVLTVVNDAGTALSLSIDGEGRGILRAGEARTLTLTVGTHATRATYRQFGRTRTLRSASITLRPGDRRTTVLEPAATTLLRVTNRTGQRARVRIDGRDGACVAANDSALVEVSVGRVRVEMVRDGRVLDGRTVTARAYAEQTVVAQLRTGELSVRNALPMKVRVAGPDGRQQVLRSGESVLLTQVEPGTVRVQVSRVTGERIGTLSVRVRAGERARVEVPAPTMALVELISDWSRPVKVIVDGRVVATLAAFDTQRVELRPGSRRVTIVDDRGRTIDQRTLRLDPYRTARFEFGQRHQAVSAR